ncbi:hypothetical protein B0H14DRAFT_3534147 [Mycena olivaceomarginata]|nr:hypothetical protein B0H14DRAFT_3534147 [Mycena olivaceomarginata]
MSRSMPPGQRQDLRDRDLGAGERWVTHSWTVLPHHYDQWMVDASENVEHFDWQQRIVLPSQRPRPRRPRLTPDALHASRVRLQELQIYARQLQAESIHFDRRYLRFSGPLHRILNPRPALAWPGLPPELEEMANTTLVLSRYASGTTGRRVDLFVMPHDAADQAVRPILLTSMIATFGWGDATDRGEIERRAYFDRLRTRLAAWYQFATQS